MRTCQVCGRDITGLHFNRKRCLRDACQKKLRKQRDAHRQETEKPDGGPVVYAMPARLGSNAKGRGHAGTHLDSDHERDQAASGLAWLLKGRTPERLNPVRVKIETRRVAWRDQTAAIYRKKTMDCNSSGNET